MTTISVLMPVYNSERYVGEAISSILSQTFRDFELLVLDDGSTDRSLSIIRKKAASDARIRYSSRENRGLVHTLNELLDQAKGALIARMDSDDVAEPDRFRCQLQAFESDPDLLALGSDVFSIDHKGRRLMTIRMPHRHEEIDAFTMGVVNGCGMCHPSIMFRLRAFDLVGRYRAEYWPAEDADLVLRIAEKGRVANLEVPLLSYRVHANSIGHSQSIRQRDALFRAAASAASRRGGSQPRDDLRSLSADERAMVESPQAQNVKWAWWALNSGNVRTARMLALRAVMQSPFRRAAWLVLACAVRGR